MNKKVEIGARPTPAVAPSAETWVAKREAVGEPTQRLTFDVPQSLHRAIKSACAQRGTKMGHEIVELLEKHYRPPEQA